MQEFQDEIKELADPNKGTLFPSVPKDVRFDRVKDGEGEERLRLHIRAANYTLEQRLIDEAMSIDYKVNPDFIERIRFTTVHFVLNVIDGRNEELSNISPPIERKASDYLSGSFTTGVEYLLEALASSDGADDAKREFTALWLQRLGEAIESGEMGSTPDEWLNKWRLGGEIVLQDEYDLARRRKAEEEPSLLSSIPVPEERELCSHVKPPIDPCSMYHLNEDHHHWQHSGNPELTRSKALYEKDVWNSMDNKTKEPFERLSDEDFARYIYQKYIVSKDYLVDDGASREWQRVIEDKAKDIPRSKASLDASMSDRYREFLTQEMKEIEEKQREQERKEAQEKEEIREAQFSDLQ